MTTTLRFRLSKMAFWVVLSTLTLSTNEATADIIYEWVNLPADQDGAQLSGTITTAECVNKFETTYFVN